MFVKQSAKGFLQIAKSLVYFVCSVVTLFMHKD